jgi:hypothetical protein
MDSRKRSRRQEKFLAKRFSGRVQPASGALSHAKGDVKTDDQLFEAKTTGLKSYSIKVETMDKIAMEAVGTGRRPALHIRFERERKDYVVLTLDDYEALLQDGRIHGH